ncbi:Retrovirus-related Pol polyprotein from transposon TNT 1-94 [Eumeta japonica]|uniref:Retrovirus-related Pol polyprotein from transposon TNT 1-94 n=1 Tax=Eumeta variegata TaxID=151549 RepID=A0A4C2A9F7_EUMVA|nr:Retrovirus-related Pol polyprotein from transposon TNT 1-94 [Eumeta japonica]
MLLKYDYRQSSAVDDIVAEVAYGLNVTIRSSFQLEPNGRGNEIPRVMHRHLLANTFQRFESVQEIPILREEVQSLVKALLLIEDMCELFVRDYVRDPTLWRQMYSAATLIEDQHSLYTRAKWARENEQNWWNVLSTCYLKQNCKTFLTEVATAAYVINRSPSRVLAEVTPYENGLMINIPPKQMVLENEDRRKWIHSKIQGKTRNKRLFSKPGIDYTEIFSPVVRLASLRYLFALAVKHNLDICQMDAVSALLADIEEEIYMKQPPM